MKAAVYRRYGPPDVVTVQEVPAGQGACPARADRAGQRASGTSALTAVIAARYPLDRIADAYRRVDAGHKKGNVVVVMA